MNNRLYLKFPTIDDKANVMNFRQEFLQNQDDKHIAGSSDLGNFQVYEEWLDKVTEDANMTSVLPDRVPATMFLVYRREDDKLVGIMQLRHSLNTKLSYFGGHIGDSIRPSERNKGYATEQIALVLEECKKLDIMRILITCKKNNIASARTIIKNGGVLENEVEWYGDIYQRYWIDIEK